MSGATEQHDGYGRAPPLGDIDPLPPLKFLLRSRRRLPEPIAFASASAAQVASLEPIPNEGVGPAPRNSAATTLNFTSNSSDAGVGSPASKTERFSIVGVTGWFDREISGQPRTKPCLGL